MAKVASVREKQGGISSLLSALKACITSKDLQCGKKLHAKAVQAGTDSNTSVAAALVNMYAKCGSMVEARRVFDGFQKPNMGSWSVMLSGYVDAGKGHAALELFSTMNYRECIPDSKIYMTALKACTSLAVNVNTRGKEDCLERGRKIHLQIGSNAHPYLQSTLIDMYAKCGSMVDARRVFDSMEKPDVVCWTALLHGYVDSGEGHIAMDMFSRMKDTGCLPNSRTYIAALKACVSTAGKKDALERIREIHSEIESHKLMDQYVQNSLIDVYSKCGSIVECQGIFDRISKPNVVSWNALLSGYAETGEGCVSLELFSRMKASGCVPNSITYLAVLKSCACLAASEDPNGKVECLKRGREIHMQIGCKINQQLQGALIDMYSKGGSMSDARLVFDGIREPDVVSWTSLILGYVEAGEGYEALDLYSRMKSRGCVRDSKTCVAALRACTSLAVNGDVSECLKQSKEIHLEIGSHSDSYVQGTLIGMYVKCGSMVDARRTFYSIRKPDVVCWTAMLQGYVENGEEQAALDLFSTMKVRGCIPDHLTYVTVLKACASLAVYGDELEKRECLERGRELQMEIGNHSNKRIQSTLIDMYAKCGSMCDAQSVFESIVKPDVVSWTAMILGYAENGKGEVALDFFTRMKASECMPDSRTYVAAIKACGFIGALSIGRKIHTEIMEFPTRVLTCLVDFYAKCGSMVEAQEVFDSHPNERDVTTWNALLAGYGSLGDGHSVFNLFERMQNDRVLPDGITFTCLLLCCSHSGLVEKARNFMDTMLVQYGVIPTVVHYTCLVDVLGRANQLNEAIFFIRGMSCNHNAVTWRTLLGACHKWKNLEIGRLAFQALAELDKKDGSGYVAMSLIYRELFECARV